MNRTGKFNIILLVSVAYIKKKKAKYKLLCGVTVNKTYIYFLTSNFNLINFFS